MPREQLLDQLEPATRAAILEAGTQVTVPEGGFLIRDGEDGRSVFLVVDGLLKVVKSSYDGRVSFLGLRRRGTIVGELAVLTGEPRNSSLQAVQPSTVVKLPDDRFERLLAEHADLSRSLLMEIAERLGEATRQIHDLMNADARTRIAARLVQLADETLEASVARQTLDLPVSQEELGDWAGLSRAGAVKALRSLRDDHLIDTSRMSITINDISRLRLVATV